MYILGINFASHDTAACLLKDGKIAGFVEEERLNRIKHTGNKPPYKAIDLLLKQEGVSISEIDYVALCTEGRQPILDSLVFGFSLRSPIIALASNLRNKRTFSRLLKEFKNRYNYQGKIILVDHHVCHLSSTFLVSPFEQSAILSIDGGGDGLTGRTAYGNGQEIVLIGKTKSPHSIGLLYEKTTNHLGFGFYGNEGKVMGLSPYGNPDRYIDVFRDIVKLDNEGRYKLNMKYFKIKKTGLLNGKFSVSDYFSERLGPPRLYKNPIEKRHEDIAASLQRITEETLFHILNDLHTKTGCENVALAGGVILNSVANGKLHKKTPFKNIFIQPVAYDAGNAIGAAFYAYHCILNRPRTYTWKHCYLGPSFSAAEIKNIMKSMRLNYETLNDPAKRAARLIAEGNIVGWFQDKVEAGARALGNRSILADPRRAEMKDIINKRVKHRESFRPFAPSILEDKIAEYFEDNIAVPSMERVFSIKPEKRNLIPAVTHIDGTGRLQSVNKKINPLYYNLIKEFQSLTGIPVILNTSFNVQGEPIVCTPQDAIKCFFTTGLDYLILDGFLIKK